MTEAEEDSRLRASPDRYSKRRKAAEKKEMIDGFSQDAYKRLVSKAGYPVNRKRVIDVDLACKMRDAGWSCNQIGRLWGISGATVKSRLKEVHRYY